MTVDMQLLRRLTPSAQRSISITAGAVALSFLIVFLAILPMRKQTQRVLENNKVLNQTLSQMLRDVANIETLKAQTAATNAQMQALLAQGVIEPLLGSIAMRGKALLDPLAQATGFRIDTVRELPPLPLQLPKPPPEQTYARQPVEFTGQGSYEQITAFIAKAEKAQPLLTLSSLLILCQQQTPERHKVIITFEWPVKGEKIKPAIPPKKK
jgi:Tfp pilus assembly protein PilO